MIERFAPMLKKYLPKNSPRAKNTVFDIHPRENFSWNSIRETVSLRRHLYRRHPILTSAGALALVLVVVLTADTFLGHANTVHWYPGSCLGGWTNSANAAGAPELGLSSDPDEFNADNSAILDNSISQIFCGNFSGDMPTDTTPEKITLDISWMFKSIPGPAGISQSAPPEIIKDAPAVPEILPAETQSSEGGSGSGDTPAVDVDSSTPPPVEDATENIPPADSSPVENPNPAGESVPPGESTPSGESVPSSEAAPAPSDPGQSSDPSSAGPSGWLFNFTKSAFAQEAPQQEISQSSENVDDQTNPATNNPPENTQENVSEKPAEEPVEESVENTIENASDTSDKDAASVANPEGAPENTPAPAEQNNFLEVRYSVDGEIWHSLGFVGELNWRDAEIPIPPMSWEDLKNLQITLVSLPVSDVAPIVYLDGVSLKVDYTDVPPDPYPAPDPARGDIFVSQITYDTNTLVLVARPPVTKKVIETPESSSTVIVATEEVALEVATTTATTSPEIGEVLPGVESIVTTTESSTTINRPVTADMTMELWVRDDVSTGWTRVAGSELLAENPMIRFEYGNIFWTGPERNSIWRFNPSSKSYESISISDGSPAIMRFADQAGGQRELILEEDDQVRFEEVKPEIDGF